MKSTIIAGTKAGLRFFGSEHKDPVDGADVTSLVLYDGVLWALLDHRHVCRISGATTARVASVDRNEAMVQM